MRSRAILAQKNAKYLAVRALGVTVPEQKKREDLIRAVDKINARYGSWTVSPAVLSLIDTHR